MVLTVMRGQVILGSFVDHFLSNVRWWAPKIERLWRVSILWYRENAMYANLNSYISKW